MAGKHWIWDELEDLLRMHGFALVDVTEESEAELVWRPGYDPNYRPGRIINTLRFTARGYVKVTPDIPERK